MLHFKSRTSKKDKPSSRYIKQIKVRSCELTYGEDNVIEARIVKEDTFLHMVPTGYGSERDNLDEPDEQDILRDEAEQEIARRLQEGETYRSISKAMGVSTKTVGRVNKIINKSTSDD